MSNFLRQITSSLMKRSIPVSENALSAADERLSRYGLHISDLYVANDSDHINKEVLRRMDPEELNLRQQRLWRATDLHLKKTVLPEHLRAQAMTSIDESQNRVMEIKAMVAQEIYDKANYRK